jgi:F0F1-type ATP synthase assembly protein I
LSKLPDSKGYRQLALATTIPIIMLAAPAVGYFIGKFLDDLLETSGVMTMIFLLLGVGAGGLESYNLIKRIANEDKE